MNKKQVSDNINSMKLADSDPAVTEREDSVDFAADDAPVKKDSYEGGLEMTDGAPAVDLGIIQEMAQEKIKGFNPEKKEDESEWQGEQIGWYTMVTRYSDCGDLMLLWFGLFGCFGFGAAMPAFCFYFGTMIDGVAGVSSDSTATAAGGTPAGGGMGDLKEQSFMMLYIGIGAWIVSWFQVTCLSIFAENVQFKIKIKYFQSVLEKDASWFDHNNPAEMSSKISKECVTIQRGSGEKIGSVVGAITTFFLGFGLAFFLGWLYTLILFGMAPIIAATGVLMAISMEDGFKEQMKSYGQSAGYAEQALQAIQVVHTYGQEALESRNYEKYLNRAEKTAHSQITKNAIGIGGMFLSFFVLYAYAFYFGGVLRWNNVESAPGVVYTGGKIIGVLFCVVFGAMMLGGAGPHLKAITEGRIAGRIAFEVIDHVPGIKVNEQGTKMLSDEEINGEIKFTNVNFTYPSRPDIKVLKGFSEVFEAGKTTALVGPSGSGKSTIIQMLERFYDPQEGQIELDGQDIKSLNLTSMRQKIGYVSQEPILFNTSIRENLLFAKPDATEDDMINALKDANAWSFIKDKFKEGLETEVGSGGGQLSGGQKQRIAIARAFIKKPKILLLDEATSALDKVNEKYVQDAIDKYRVKYGGITIVVIAHRLSTIVDSDKIVVIKDGVKCEVGTNETLLRDYPEGVYANFCAKQANAEANAEQAENSDEEKQLDAEIKQSEAKLGDVSINKSAGSLNMSRKLSMKVEISPEELEKKEQSDKKDAEVEAKVKALAEKNEKVGAFSKLMVYNDPKILILIGLICIVPSGLANPICGIAFAKILTLLSIPVPFLKYIDPAGVGGTTYMKNEIIFWSIVMLIIAGVCFFSFSITKKCFGTLGNNVTLTVRKILYAKILEKNIGFFDHPENGTSVLTNAMASDTHLVNGVGSESIQPQLEAAMNMLGGVAIGFYFCWQESLLCLLLTPILIIGNVIGMKFQSGLTEESSDGLKEANLLCGDSIVNFRTVQSFGNTQLVVDKFKSFIYPGHLKAQMTYIKIGFAFGISQFGQYFVFAAMFYGAGQIIETNPEIKMDDIMISLMAIMFGASQAGSAAAFGPDMGKAIAAAARIFAIIETESEINAMEIDTDSTKKRLDLKEVKGHIEFRGVWFRYPTRKNDFVLRGLNITVEPGQSIALVGESGCGKSTFVNLLMRFYDVDHGEVLLDGTNIKDINLHDLRNAISLVMQEPIIFNYSVLENILYGKTNATNSEVQHCAEVSNCLEFIEKNDTANLDDSATYLLKQYQDNKFGLIAILGEPKYNEEIEVLEKCKEQEESGGGKFEAVYGDIDTRSDSLRDVQLSNGFKDVQCGMKGSKLSGGQKQRVAIARTIIREPRVLLLDEATSALDEDSQKKVQEALNNAMKGRTTIIIAHRMSTIEGCDKIYVLDCGKVLEEGNFEELKAKKDGFFAKKDQKEAAATNS